MKRALTWSAGALCAATLSLAHAEGALLRCQVTYAGATQEVHAQPMPDPYDARRVDIGGRFWFKPVLVGQGARVDYIALYAYVDTHRGPVLIQQAKYLPPFPATPTAQPLTGEQHLYAGPVERELIYHCTLEGHQP